MTTVICERILGPLKLATMNACDDSATSPLVLRCHGACEFPKAEDWQSGEGEG